MEQRTLGVAGPVSAVGLGCMGMSGAYGPTDRSEAIATIHAALDAGVTLARHRRLLRHGAQRAPHRRGPPGPGPGRACCCRSSSVACGTPAADSWASTGARQRSRLPRLQPAATRDRPRRHLPSGPPRPGRADRGDGRGRRGRASRPGGSATSDCPRSVPTPSAGPTPSTPWPTSSSSTPSCPAAWRTTILPTTRELGIADDRLRRTLPWPPVGQLVARPDRSDLGTSGPTPRGSLRGTSPPTWPWWTRSDGSPPTLGATVAEVAIAWVASRGDDIVPVDRRPHAGTARRRAPSRPPSRSTTGSWPQSRPPCPPGRWPAPATPAPQMAGLDSER